MKYLVLDTNVLVSGLLSSSGPPGTIVGLLMDAQLAVVYNEPILEEYREVLARPKFKLEPSEMESILDQLVSVGLVVETHPWPLPLPDQDDGHFLAVAAMADCPLVTGNLRHYPEKIRGKVLVKSPKEFLTSVQLSS